jgi:uncharacterized protein
MENEVISSTHINLICTAISVGTLARILTVKEDFRQYPSYPNGYLTNLVTGFVAAALGAVAIPALMTKNFIAVTFLTLAIQQFRDVRKSERESLKDLEHTEFTERGEAYIDGIAKTFEARNYFALVVSFGAALCMQLLDSNVWWVNTLAGIVTGAIILYVLRRFSKGKTIGDIAVVKEAKVEVIESSLYINGHYTSNTLGSDDASRLFAKEGMAVVIAPKEKTHRLILDHDGQRQAALFEAARVLGLKRYHFVRKNFETGEIYLALVPIVGDIGGFIEAVNKTPLLESTKKSRRVMDTNLAGRR